MESAIAIDLRALSVPRNNRFEHKSYPRRVILMALLLQYEYDPER